MWVALVDCNNFYVSCERVFNPRLRRRPVVILSGNDGIVIARSNETKALGVPMGAPYFEYRRLLENHHAAVLSSNFSLYGDLSRRIMESLESFSPQVQVYSVDEAFLDFNIPNKIKEAEQMRQKLFQWIGIPVSVGIATTKTLAKLASRCAKKCGNGVFLLDEKNTDALLSQTPIEEVWGIGKRSAATLRAGGILSAAALRDADDGWIRKTLSVNGLRTAWELRGTPCLEFDEVPQPQQSITCSRTFGVPIHTLKDLSEAFATYTVRAAEKLRRENAHVSAISLFAFYHPYKGGSAGARIVLPQVTAYTPELLRFVQSGVKQLYKEGARYRKAGVHFEGLVPAKNLQKDLFTNANVEQQQRTMALIDSLNKKYKIKIASEGLEQSWKSRLDKRSPRYTTSWDDLLLVGA